MTSSWPKDPYRGIKSFRYLDAQVYAGRKMEVDKIRKLIYEFRGMLLYGNSGVGKSSLISAGLIPKLEGESNFIFSPEIIRLNADYQGTFVVSRIRNEEEKNSFKPSLFDRFIGDDDKNEDRINVSINDFEATLLSSLESELEAQKSDPEQKVIVHVLIFDQFEELITLFEENTRVYGREKKFLGLEGRLNLQKQIIDLLTRLYFNGTVPVKLILVFREDYLARFGKLFNNMPDLKDHYLRIKPLGTEFAREIIQRPFDSEEKRMLYKRNFSEKIIGFLVDKIKERYPEGSINLTEVQIVCLQLYEKPEGQREATLSKDEGIDLLVENYYLKLLNKIDEAKRPIAVDILSLLVLNDTTRNILHKEAILDGLREHEIDTVEEVLKSLESDIQIIRRENRQGGLYFEIITEAIIPFINRKRIEKEQKKAYDAKLYRDAQSNRKRKQFGLLGGLAAFFIILAVATFYTYQQSTVQAYLGWNEKDKILQKVIETERGPYPAYLEAKTFMEEVNQLKYIAFDAGSGEDLMDSVRHRVERAFDKEPFYGVIEVRGQFSPSGRYHRSKAGGDTLYLRDHLDHKDFIKVIPADLPRKEESGTTDNFGGSGENDLMGDKYCVVKRYGYIIVFDYGPAIDPVRTYEIEEQFSPDLKFSYREDLLICKVNTNAYSTEVINYKIISLPDGARIDVKTKNEEILNVVRDRGGKWILYSESSPEFSYYFGINTTERVFKDTYDRRGKWLARRTLANVQTSPDRFDFFSPSSQLIRSTSFAFYRKNTLQNWKCFDLSKVSTSEIEFVEIPASLHDPIDLLTCSFGTFIFDSDGTIYWKDKDKFLPNVREQFRNDVQKDLNSDPYNIVVDARFSNDSTLIFMIAPPYLAVFDLKSEQFRFFNQFDKGVSIRSANLTSIISPTQDILVIAQPENMIVWFWRNKVEMEKWAMWEPKSLPDHFNYSTGDLHKMGIHVKMRREEP